VDHGRERGGLDLRGSQLRLQNFVNQYSEEFSEAVSASNRGDSLLRPGGLRGYAPLVAEQFDECQAIRQPGTRVLEAGQWASPQGGSR